MVVADGFHMESPSGDMRGIVDSDWRLILTDFVFMPTRSVTIITSSTTEEARWQKLQ